MVNARLIPAEHVNAIVDIFLPQILEQFVERVNVTLASELSVMVGDQEFFDSIQRCRRRIRCRCLSHYAPWTRL